MPSTRSMTRRQSRRLLTLSHDELGVIADGLADPLQPEIAVALSSVCVGLRMPLKAMLENLHGQHERARTLCRKLGKTCATMRDADQLHCDDDPEEIHLCIDDDDKERFTVDDLATLAMILSTSGLPQLDTLRILDYDCCDAVFPALCDGLMHGAPVLRKLWLEHLFLGPASAKALASALGESTLRRLEYLDLRGNLIGAEGMSTLAVPLRKMPALKCLGLGENNLGAEGVAALVANLGKDDFKELEILDLHGNAFGDERGQSANHTGWSALADAIAARRSECTMPHLYQLYFWDNPLPPQSAENLLAAHVKAEEPFENNERRGISLWSTKWKPLRYTPG